MNVRLWGTRGSVPTPGAQNSAYGGNTACVEVCATPEAIVVLDAGTGVQQLGRHIPGHIERIDILLTHLHMDHIIGLGFFEVLRRGGLEVHIWGPASATLNLRGRLSRYLSPPLFPVRIRDLECALFLHDIALGSFEIPGLEVSAELVCHPGPTVGYRLTDATATVTYLPDHEPALGARSFPGDARWTSGYALAEGADLLIHDSQYTDEEYASKIGWGHSALSHAVAFARFAEVGRLVAFHHDPTHSDEMLDAVFAGFDDEGVIGAREGHRFVVGADPAPPAGAGAWG